jgi:signal transduction histidine kinase
VLQNLVRNAAQALRDARGDRPDGLLGRVAVSAEVADGAFVIDVDDDGPGIAPEVAPQIFDPYVTTKRDGTGLGLSIVKKIVVDHGGTIDFARSPLGGARFRISIPRAGTASSRAAAERAEAREADEPAPPNSSRARGAFE